MKTHARKEPESPSCTPNIRFGAEAFSKSRQLIFSVSNNASLDLLHSRKLPAAADPPLLWVNANPSAPSASDSLCSGANTEHLGVNLLRFQACFNDYQSDLVKFEANRTLKAKLVRKQNRVVFQASRVWFTVEQKWDFIRKYEQCKRDTSS